MEAATHKRTNTATRSDAGTLEPFLNIERIVMMRQICYPAAHGERRSGRCELCVFPHVVLRLAERNGVTQGCAGALLPSRRAGCVRLPTPGINNRLPDALLRGGMQDPHGRPLVDDKDAHKRSAR
jgi:hypothetical protein